MLRADLNAKNIPKTATIRNRGYPNTGRSHESQDSINNNSIQVEPWRGQEYYCRVKKSIYQNKRAQSATTKMANIKNREKMAKTLFSKMHTVQIQLTPLPVQHYRPLSSKWAQQAPITTSVKESFAFSEKYQQKQKPIKLATVSLLEPELIHLTIPSWKNIHSKIRIEKTKTQISRKKIIQDTANFENTNQKKSLLFFFQTKNNCQVQRQKMIMKLRNIQRGKSKRSISHFN